VIQKDFKSLATFPFANHHRQNEDSSPFLQYIHDISIAPQGNITLPYENTLELLMPVAGSVFVPDETKKEWQVKPEQCLFLPGKPGQAYEVKNSYETQWINYLHIGLKSKNALLSGTALIADLKLKNSNMLLSLEMEKVIAGAFGYTGIYTGRGKETYTLKNKSNGLFLFVIKGSFEAGNRLIEYRDGLSLWDVEEIEFEALAAHSTILVLEIPRS